MALAVKKGVKVVLKLVDGSQTISECNMSATDDQLLALGSAVSKLVKEEVETITKVEETTLIGE